MIDDAEMMECYRHCANIGAIAMVHAENGMKYSSLSIYSADFRSHYC